MDNDEKVKSKDKMFAEDTPQKDLKKREYLVHMELSSEEEKDLVLQVKKEIENAKKHIQPWLERKYRHIKLYNNQVRKKDKVGESLLFTVFQTLLAATYDDQLNVNFRGRTEMDIEKAMKLNQTAEYDYDLMDKAIYDYHMRWNALFYGRGIGLMMDYDANVYVPKPYVIDPLVLLHDPRGSSIRGGNIGTKCAYLGYEITLDRETLEDSGEVKYINVDKLSWGVDVSKSMQYRAREFRDDAQSRQTVNDDDNSAVGYRWFTRFQKKNIVLTVGLEGEVILLAHEIKDDELPFVEMAVFPTPNDFHGVSVADLVEDKQRLKSVLTNLGIKLLDVNLNPKMAYDKTKIDDEQDLHPSNENPVAVDGDPASAIRPLQNPVGNLPLYDYITNQLDFSVQRAAATPEIQQGVMSTKERTLGELNLVANASNTRYSLMIKLMALSERDFWLQWYKLHKVYLPDSMKKFVRISGELNPNAIELTREDITLEEDPDIDIESKTLTESKRVRALTYYAQFYQMFRQNPTANGRYVDKLLARLIGLDDEQIELMFPDTPDEIIADSENIAINNNELPIVSINDNHMQHIMVHGNAADTNAKTAHIQEHKRAMKIMKTQLGMGIEPISPTPGGQPTNGQPSQQQPSTQTPMDAGLNSLMG